MKYKVLLTGNNQAMFDEFFTHMNNSFECQTCSCRYEDMASHLKYFEPEVFVYCMKSETPDAISAVSALRGQLVKAGVLIAVTGDLNECSDFSQQAPYVAELTLTRPITNAQIQEQICRSAEGKRLLKSSPLSSGSPQPDDSKTAGGRRHILVVDDDPRMLKLIKAYLADQYDVATAINGKVALKFLETKKTDLILLDYEMPGENGARILEKLRLNPDTVDLPVIFLTGVSDRDKIKEVLSLKPQGYLLKPVSRGKLSTSIKSILERGGIV